MEILLTQLMNLTNFLFLLSSFHKRKLNTLKRICLKAYNSAEAGKIFGKSTLYDEHAYKISLQCGKNCWGLVYLLIKVSSKYTCMCTTN